MLRSAEIFNYIGRFLDKNLALHDTTHLEGGNESLELLVISVDLTYSLVFGIHRLQERAGRLLLNELGYLIQKPLHVTDQK